MHFDLIESVSLAGSVAAPNDDRAGVADTHAWVIDGATDLGPPGLVGARGGAAWLATAAHAAFTAATDAPITAMCAAVADHLAASYATARTRAPEGRWELPVAAFLAARIDGDSLECGWLGDCVGLRARAGGVTRIGPAHAARDAETEQASRLAAHGLGTIERSGPILADLRASRGRPGLRVLGVDPGAAVAPETKRLACAHGDDLLLMTDGFAALIDAYAEFEPAALIDALPALGLAALALRVRAIEAQDAACARFPRFKRSDDATALWLRMAA